MTLTLRNIPPDLDAALRRKAAEQQRSVDQIAVEAMTAGLGLETHVFNSRADDNLATAIRARFAPLGGLDLPDAIREPMRVPPDFGK